MIPFIYKISYFYLASIVNCITRKDFLLDKINVGSGGSSQALAFLHTTHFYEFNNSTLLAPAIQDIYNKNFQNIFSFYNFSLNLKMRTHFKNICNLICRILLFLMDFL